MHFDYLNYYIYGDEPPKGAGASFNGELASHEFCRRLHAAYLLASRDYESVYGPDQTEYWEQTIIQGNRNDIRSLLNAKAYKKGLRYVLSNPIAHNLWYGFDNVAKRFAESGRNVNSYRIHDILRRFHEAVGGKVWQAERGAIPDQIDTEEILAHIEKATGANLDFPAPYPRMDGIVDMRGIIRSRALWGLYMAWRAKEHGAQNILELGGGLGYGAYYASLLGARNYAIVDIPLTLVASGHFLGLVKGEEKIQLYGAEINDNQIFHLLPPNAFPDEKKFDIVVNMDSFPEFGLEIARDYVGKIKKVTKKFLSINHEGERYTVRELFANDPDVVRYIRQPFWLRKGYVEELFEFS